MKLATYRRIGETITREGADQLAPARCAWLQGDGSLVDVLSAYEYYVRTHPDFAQEGRARASRSLLDLIQHFDVEGWDWLKSIHDSVNEDISNGLEEAEAFVNQAHDVEILLPFAPKTFRDFYAFEKHVKTCRQKRGLEMVPEWYHFPVFYFSNPLAFRGPNESISRPKRSNELDFELEVACVIGKTGSSIPRQHAHEYIAGYLVLNDWSLRDIQREEVKVGLGPAKGKDFATSMGPYLVTPDELHDVATRTEDGTRHSLTMSAKVNGRQVSEGQLRDLFYTFEQMIERASLDTTIYPGEVIGSGTVGTGCILELGPEVQSWLNVGDVVELVVERLGILKNQIV